MEATKGMCVEAMHFPDTQVYQDATEVRETLNAWVVRFCVEVSWFAYFRTVANFTKKKEKDYKSTWKFSLQYSPIFSVSRG